MMLVIVTQFSSTNGTYYEHVVVNKIINLIGENKSTTIIDGGGEKQRCP